MTRNLAVLGNGKKHATFDLVTTHFEKCQDPFLAYDLTKRLPGRSAARVMHEEDGTHAQTIQAVYMSDPWVREIRQMFDDVLSYEKLEIVAFLDNTDFGNQR